MGGERNWISEFVFCSSDAKFGTCATTSSNDLMGPRVNGITGASEYTDLVGLVVIACTDDGMAVDAGAYVRETAVLCTACDFDEFDKFGYSENAAAGLHC